MMMPAKDNIKQKMVTGNIKTKPNQKKSAKVKKQKRATSNGQMVC